MLYISPWSRFELTISVVIGTDCIGSCNSNYHRITTTMVLWWRNYNLRIIYNTISYLYDQIKITMQHKFIIDLIICKPVAIFFSGMFPRQDHSPWLDCCIYCWVQSQIGKIVGKIKRWIPILQAYIKLIVFHCSLMHIHVYGATCMYLYLQNTVISSDNYTLSSPPDRILGNLFIIFLYYFCLFQICWQLCAFRQIDHGGATSLYLPFFTIYFKKTFLSY